MTIKYRTVREITARNISTGDSFRLEAGSILTPFPIHYQSDPDWCLMHCGGIAISVHNDDIEEVQ